MENFKAFGRITELIPEKIQPTAPTKAGQTCKVYEKRPCSNTRSNKSNKGGIKVLQHEQTQPQNPNQIDFLNALSPPGIKK